MKTIEAKVHMLPVSENVIISESNCKGLVYKCGQNLSIFDNLFQQLEKGVPQHLYITTDEEIKEGDWFIHPDATVPQNDFNYVYADCKKIIATTDTLLVASHEDYDNFDTALPKIPQSFIEEYCKAGGIDEVLVEVELKMEVTSYSKSGCGNFEPLSTGKPKLNPDNTIIIHPVKEKMYSREEVIRLCEKAAEWGYENMLDNEGEITNQWIEENL